MVKNRQVEVLFIGEGEVLREEVLVARVLELGRGCRVDPLPQEVLPFESIFGQQEARMRERASERHQIRNAPGDTKLLLLGQQLALRDPVLIE